MVKSFLFIFLLTLSYLSGTLPQIRYYRTEKDFLQNISITESQLGWRSYIAVHFDSSGRVIKKQYYKRKRKPLNFEIYKYDSTTGDLHLRSFFDKDSTLTKEIIFGPNEKLSSQYIQYVYGIDHLVDFGDRFTEVVYKKENPSVVRFYDVNTFCYGELNYQYDENGILRQEDWILKPENRLIRRFLYDFNPTTEVTEIREYDSTLIEVSHIRLTKDKKALIFTVDFPQDSSFINTTQVSYTLSENLKYGTITWNWESGMPDTAAPHVAILTPIERKKGNHTLIHLFNSPNLIDGATYNITFSGTGTSEYPVADIVLHHIQYDLVPPEYTIDIAPYLNKPVISYFLSESLSKGIFLWVWQGGEIDSLSPYLFTISPGLVERGEHNQVLFADELNLHDGSIYEVEFWGQDFAGNVGATVHLKGIHYDQTPPRLILTHPQNNESINDRWMTYELTEDLFSGSFTWIERDEMGGVISTTLSELVGSELTAGIYEKITLTNMPVLKEGRIYDLIWTGVDLAGNISDSLYITRITYDTTSPKIVIDNPVSHSIVNRSTIIYSISEDLSEGNIEWKQFGVGFKDTVYVYHLKESNLQKGDHIQVDSEKLPLLKEGAKYDITIKGKDLAGNHSIPFTVSGIKYDATPPQISILHPSKHAFINTEEISYTLSETCKEGTIIWMRVGGNVDIHSPYILPLKESDLTQGIHEKVGLEGESNLNDSSLYQIMFVVKDSAENVSDQIVIDSVTYDVTSPKLAIISPESNLAISDPQVAFMISESLKVANLIWEWIEGSYDVFAPHEIPLLQKHLSKGYHQPEKEDYVPHLIDGAVYSLYLSGTDLAGNDSRSETKTNILFDASPPLISDVSLKSNSYVNSIEISYTLSETLDKGRMVWEQVGGRKDLLSPHIIELEGEDLKSGVHSQLKESVLPVLQDGSIYNVTISGEDRAGNKTNVITISHIVYDITNPVFEITYPDPYAPISQVEVSYQLSENLGKGVIKFLWTGGTPDSIEHTILLNQDVMTEGNHILVPLEEIKLIEGAIYNVVFEGQDSAGNQSSQYIINGVIFDSQPPQFVDIFPREGMVYSMPSVAYTLSESLEKGVIIWEQTGGPEDPDSPHIVELVESELLSGEHSQFIVTNTPVLKDSAIYTLKFLGEDGAGNKSDTVMIKNVRYDFSPPEIDVTFPLSGIYISSPQLSYHLSENLAGSTLLWDWESGNKDNFAPHSVSFKKLAMKKGSYQNISFTEPLNLIPGAFYTLKILGWDLAGNKSIPITITHIGYDPIPPEFVVTYPQNNDYVNHSQVTYSLSETIEEGWIIWERIGGTMDSYSPHFVELIDEELLMGEKSKHLLNNPPQLQDGSIYNISFVGIDRAGNVSDTVKIINIFYDISKPEIGVQYPIAYGYERTKSISYSLSENIKSGTVIWRNTGRKEDPDSPHIISMVGDELLKGIHEDQFLLNSPDLVDGSEYELIIAGMDSAGNQSDSTIIPHIIYDITPPTISIIFPTEESFINSSSISYTLSETVRMGQIDWIAMEGTSDPDAPHSVQLVEKELYKGSHFELTLFHEFNLHDGTIYQIKMVAQDSAGNISDTVIINNITYDISTPKILVDYPDSNSFVANTSLSYELSEDLFEGWVIWGWTGGSPDSDAPHKRILSEKYKSKGDHPHIIWEDEPHLIDGAIYTVLIYGEDKAGNSSERIEIPGIIFDKTAPEISDLKPDNHSFIQESIVSYHLSEQLQFGELNWVQTEGEFDPNSPHRVILIEDELTQGVHYETKLANQSELHDGSIYSLMFFGTDIAGNSSDTLLVIDVTYDKSPPIITVQSPNSESFVNNALVNYTLSEDLASGQISWIYKSGSKDMNSPHIIQLNQEARKSGEHINIDLLSPDHLIDGTIYDVSILGTDFAGNSSDTVKIQNILFDVTAPDIVIRTPIPNSFHNHTLITYVLSEELGQGNVIWERIGGQPDEFSPHIVLLTGEELTPNEHTNLEMLFIHPLKDGSIYQIKMIGTDKAGNVSDTVVVRDIHYDITIPEYEIQVPVSGAFIHSSIISYVLSEPLKEGHFVWERIGGNEDPNSPHEVLLVRNERVTGLHEKVFLMNSPQLINGAVYFLKFRGKDMAGNEGKEIIIENISYDDQPPAITVNAPNENSFINSIEISYSLSEKLQWGKITFEWVGGTVDSVSSHDVNLNQDELTSGTHIKIDLSQRLSLMEGGIYHLFFEGGDIAGNEASPISVENIRYDALPPVISVSFPLDSLSINSSDISFELSETLQSGSVTWERVGGKEDPESPYHIEFNQYERKAGDHKNIHLENAPSLRDGVVYQIIFEGVDLAGNIAIPVVVNNVYFDITPPEIIADAPAPGSFVNTSQISYILTEDLSEGKVIWIPLVEGKENYDTRIEKIMSEALRTKGDHRNVLLNPPLNSGMIYTIRFSGKDFAGNEASGMIIPSVTFDNNPPQLTIDTPQDNVFIRELIVSYTFSERLSKATFTWLQEGTPEDLQYPHIISLINEELNAGSHQNVHLKNIQNLPDGIPYSITLEGTDLAGNVGNLVTVHHVVYDSTSPVITITSPHSGDYLNTLSISYTLSEELKYAIATWTFLEGHEDLNSPHLIPLEGEDLHSGEHSNVKLVHQSSLLDGTIYQLSFSGEDFAGNPLKYTSVENIHYDITPPEILNFSLKNDSYFNKKRISYSLSENLKEGTMIWQQVGGSEDVNSPHTILLVGDELSMGTHVDIFLINFPDIVDGAQYDIQFDAVDLAGNRGGLLPINRVTYDTSSPIITITNPVNHSFVNHVWFSYELSESLAEGLVKWISSSDGSEISKPLKGEMLTFGTHEGVEFPISPQLVDGESYTILIKGRDLAGNEAVSKGINNFTYDITPPKITIISPEPHTLVKEKMIDLSINENLDSATVFWIRESGAEDNNSPHKINLTNTYLMKGKHLDVQLPGFEQIQVGTIYTIMVQGLDLAGNESLKESVQGIDVIQDLEGDWLFQGTLITVVWSFREESQFSQGVMMGSRISNEEPGSYRLNFTTKPFKMEFNFESGIKRYALFEFTGNNKMRVVTSTKPPESWTDGDLMYFEKREKEIP